MRLWILSDLHLDSTRGWDLPPAGTRPDFDVLVAAGDLFPRMDRGVRWLAERVTDRPVIYVAGNHESFGTDIDRTVEKALEATKPDEMSPRDALEALYRLKAMLPAKKTRNQ